MKSPWERGSALLSEAVTSLLPRSNKEGLTITKAEKEMRGTKSIATALVIIGYVLVGFWREKRGGFVRLGLFGYFAGFAILIPRR